MSILKNGNVPCLYSCNFHVNFKEGPMSCRQYSLMSINSLSHVDFKKCLCPPVNFKGQGPLPTFYSNVHKVLGCQCPDMDTDTDRQCGLVVKHPPDKQEVWGSNPTAAIQIEKKKLDIGRSPYTEGAPMVHQGLRGRPADQS